MSWFDFSSYALAGTPPPARSFHGFTCMRGKLYVHGGAGYGGIRGGNGDVLRWEDVGRDARV